MTLDPVIFLAFQFFLAIVFIYGGAQKLMSIDKFDSVLHGYRLLPPSLVRFFALGLPVAEVLIGLMLVTGYALALGIYGAIALLLTVTSAVIINLKRGNLEINCGCGGLSDHSKITWAIPTRNAVLLLGALSLLMNQAQREFSHFDVFTASVFVLALLGLYIAINQLISNSPLLKTLRRAK